MLWSRSLVYRDIELAAGNDKHEGEEHGEGPSRACPKLLPFPQRQLLRRLLLFHLGGSLVPFWLMTLFIYLFIYLL